MSWCYVSSRPIEILYSNWWTRIQRRFSVVLVISGTHIQSQTPHELMTNWNKIFARINCFQLIFDFIVYSINTKWPLHSTITKKNASFSACMTFHIASVRVTQNVTVILLLIRLGLAKCQTFYHFSIGLWRNPNTWRVTNHRNRMIFRHSNDRQSISFNFIVKLRLWTDCMDETLRSQTTILTATVVGALVKETTVVEYQLKRKRVKKWLFNFSFSFAALLCVSSFCSAPHNSQYIE